MSHIDDKVLSHLFKLARIAEEHDPARREKLISDLSKILDYFSQLQEVDTEGVLPLAGGTIEKNVWRDDESKDRSSMDISDPETLRAQFPEAEQSHLKVPPVF